VYELSEDTDVTEEAGDKRETSEIIDAGLSTEETWLPNDERRLSLPTKLHDSTLPTLAAGTEVGGGVRRGEGR